MVKLPEIGEQFGYWKVLETGLINPDTKSQYYKGRPVYSKCICTNCNKTISLKNNGDLNRARKENRMCNACRSLQRNAEARPQIGDTFYKLTVIADGGVTNLKHYSICKCECGNITRVRDNNLKTGEVRSCGCMGSIGEDLISQILKENNIIFEHDKIYPPLLAETGRKLRFDFIIYNEDGTLNRFIEFDGNQHKTGMWGGSWSPIESFDVIQERDNIKNEFCFKHNYILLRIPYSKLNSLTIEDLLGNTYIYKKEESEKNNDEERESVL